MYYNDNDRMALFFTMQWQVFFGLGILFSINIAVAADINLTLDTHSIDENVTVTVENSSKQTVRISAVSIELDGKKYDVPLNLLFPLLFSFQIKQPNLQGSYALNT
ncbi:hypothetical protein BGP_2786 [Beggiatoa sp. PS]|nr:hypothetical protein BGP_2786 [Beggiatoa sp. PS]